MEGWKHLRERALIWLTSWVTSKCPVTLYIKWIFFFYFPYTAIMILLAESSPWEHVSNACSPLWAAFLPLSKPKQSDKGRSAPGRHTIPDVSVFMPKSLFWLQQYSTKCAVLFCRSAAVKIFKPVFHKILPCPHLKKKNWTWWAIWGWRPDIFFFSFIIF